MKAKFFITRCIRNLRDNFLSNTSRILAINNYYRLIWIINGYIDYFYIRIKDLIGLFNSQPMIINLYKSALIRIHRISLIFLSHFILPH